MHNTNTGSGAGQVFKGDQNFYGPMVNNNDTNASVNTVNSDNVNSVIRDGTNTTYWSGNQSAAGAIENTLKQQGESLVYFVLLSVGSLSIPLKGRERSGLSKLKSE